MFSVGQKLWLVPNEYARYIGEPHEVEIEKVGRAWLTIKNGRYRVCIKTLAINGSKTSSSLGFCYLRKEVWEAERNLKLAWDALRSEIQSSGWRAPKGLTAERIKEARELLFGGCGACGDACKSRGSCRVADESPPII